ncbi:MAG: cobalt-precorrin-5B (C(1))-methyltransferase [Notoacmeibacter sp.]
MVETEIHNGKRKPQAEMRQGEALRRGWTTGACATAATKAAITALLTGAFPDPVMITLPKGETPAFPLQRENLSQLSATAAIIKDAGDDPDVTHGATVWSKVRFLPEGSGVVFKAGDGVGTVTKSGLPIGVGEAAINPVPRQMMQQVVDEICAQHGIAADIEITIGIENGAELALKTWNPRLGIVGGLSVLGTTGIVHPFSCSAWIHSIHRGIDVARAEGLAHVIAATGSTSEDAAQAIYNLPEIALIDMGDFAGGLLKYLRVHPVPKLTISGGFAKLAKLADGALDLHSGRSQVNIQSLHDCLEGLVADKKRALTNEISSRLLNANSALDVLELSQELEVNLPLEVARLAHHVVMETLRRAPVEVEIIVCARDGKVLARYGT